MFWFKDDWGQFGRTYQRVAEHLARSQGVARVVCTFPPLREQTKGADQAIRMRCITNKLTLMTETNYERYRLPTGVSKIVRWLNDRHRVTIFHRELFNLGYRPHNTLLWLFPPHFHLERLLRVVPHFHSIAHVLDDFTEFDPKHELYHFARRQYPLLANLVDTIFVSSKANFDKFSGQGVPCYLVPPAVDESFIGEPSVLPHKVSGDAPRLGYVGWIMDRTDLDLIGYIASSRPGWRLILVGPQYPADILERSGLTVLPNVDYQGPLPQAEVPGFLRSLDVCLIPHRDTPYSRSMGPLKLYQYLASGRPVVATAIEGLELIRSNILVAANYQSFVAHIETVLAEDTPEVAAERIEAARKHTWSIRVDEALNLAKRVSRTAWPCK